VLLLNPLTGDFSGRYNVKLCDFGLAKVKSSSQSSKGTFVGTYEWMAPEMFADMDYTFVASADMYSFGMVLWEIASRTPPYQTVRNKVMIPNIVSQGRVEAVPAETPPPLAEIITRCRDMAAANRPTSVAAKEALLAMNLSEFDPVAHTPLHESVFQRGMAAVRAEMQVIGRDAALAAVAAEANLNP